MTAGGGCGYQGVLWSFPQCTTPGAGRTRGKEAGPAAPSAGPRLRSPPWEPGDRVRWGSLCLAPLLTSKETQTEGGARCLPVSYPDKRIGGRWLQSRSAWVETEAMRVCRRENLEESALSSLSHTSRLESKHLLRIFIYLLHDKTQKVTTS